MAETDNLAPHLPRFPPMEDQSNMSLYKSAWEADPSRTGTHTPAVLPMPQLVAGSL